MGPGRIPHAVPRGSRCLGMRFRACATTRDLPGFSATESGPTTRCHPEKVVFAGRPCGMMRGSSQGRPPLQRKRRAQRRTTRGSPRSVEQPAPGVILSMNPVGPDTCRRPTSTRRLVAGFRTSPRPEPARWPDRGIAPSRPRSIRGEKGSGQRFPIEWSRSSHAPSLAPPPRSGCPSPVDVVQEGLMPNPPRRHVRADPSSRLTLSTTRRRPHPDERTPAVEVSPERVEPQAAGGRRSAHASSAPPTRTTVTAASAR